MSYSQRAARFRGKYTVVKRGTYCSKRGIEISVRRAYSEGQVLASTSGGKLKVRSLDSQGRKFTNLVGSRTPGVAPFFHQLCDPREVTYPRISVSVSVKQRCNYHFTKEESKALRNLEAWPKSQPSIYLIASLCSVP